MTQVARPRTWQDVPVDFTTVPPEEESDARDLERYMLEAAAGRLEEEDFRRIRLMNGIYGIRGAETLHMVRVKSPGGRLDAPRLRMMGRIASEHSRGFGHITTRQNFQFHLVPREDTPRVMRMVASVGLTTREACGDTFRTIQADPLAGLVADHPFDVTPWAEAATVHFLRNPIGQRLPRKFKVNFSGNDDDLGQTAVNCIGPVATLDPETGALGFKVYVGGGLGTTPFEAKLLEPFTPMEWLIPTMEAIVRIFNVRGNRENRNRARLKWLVEELGIDAFRDEVAAERRAVLAASGTNTGIPESVLAAGGHLRIVSTTPAPLPGPSGHAGFDSWASTNVIPTVDGRYAVWATAPLGDVTTEQFLSLADITEDFGPTPSIGADVRISNRQNILFRGIDPTRARELWERLDSVGMGEANVHSAGDPVACPGADTCNIAVTQSRGLAKAIRQQLADEGLAETPLRINISGCSNSCGQHHLGDIGFFGLERRSRDEGRSLPGFQMLVGGGLYDDGARFGRKLGKPLAKRTPDAVVDIVRRFEAGRMPGERFRDWVDRVGPQDLKAGLKRHDEIPSEADDPDAYVDWDETVGFEVAIGQSECN